MNLIHPVKKTGELYSGKIIAFPELNTLKENLESVIILEKTVIIMHHIHNYNSLYHHFS